VDAVYGDPDKGHSRTPYDAFAMKLRFGGGSSLSEARVRGRLLGQPLGDGGVQFSVVQSYDFQKNDAYATGSQAFEAALGFTKNLSSTTEYISAVNGNRQLVVDRRELTDQERLEEALFTGLRLARGLDLDAIRARYGVDVWQRYGRELQPFLDEGLLIYDRRLRLTRAGMLLAHEIMTVFIGVDVR